MADRPMISTLAAILAGAGLLGGTAAQAAEQCVPRREAESLLLAVAPPLIGAVAASCAAALPASALLRRSVAPLTAKYAGEADAAWPLARQALKKIVGPDAAGMLDSELARPMLTAMLVPMVAKDIKPGDCADIDRILTLIDPLPARATAALVVTIIEIADRGKAKGAKSKLAVCPTAPALP